MKAVNNDDAGRIVDAYNNMNKFLAAFLDHVSESKVPIHECRRVFNYEINFFPPFRQALKDLDYEVREKLFVEQLLDIEFSDSLDRGVFYIG